MQPSTSQDALGQLQQQQAGAKSAADILNNQRTTQGVQGAEDTVKGLRGAITNTSKLLTQVAPSVMGRTASSLVTSAQAGKQIQNEQQPIAQNLSQQTQDYGVANEDLSRASSRASEAANMEYGDQQNKMSYMQNLYNTLFGREQAAQQAEQARQQQAEQARQFNESLAAQKSAAAKSSSGGGGYDLSALLGGGGSKATVDSLFQGYDPGRDKMYTEKVVIPTLIKQGMSQAQASKSAYEYRKKNFGQ